MAYYANQKTPKSTIDCICYKNPGCVLFSSHYTWTEGLKSFNKISPSFCEVFSQERITERDE